MDIFLVCLGAIQYFDMHASVDVTEGRGDVLLWERVQQNAPMVPMRTMRATKAPTAIPMMTATGRDSAESNKEKCPSPIPHYKHLKWITQHTQQHTAIM